MLAFWTLFCLCVRYWISLMYYNQILLQNQTNGLFGEFGKTMKQRYKKIMKIVKLKKLVLNCEQCNQETE